MAYIGAEPQLLLPWRGGLDTITNPIVADPQNLAEATNIDFGLDGRREKRGGSITLNKSPIFEFE